MPLKFVSGDHSSESALIKGDNLKVMNYLLEQKNLREKIDMVYIDPPFSTNSVFRINKEHTKTISSSLQDKIAYEDLLKGEEYLNFIKERLLLIRELMSDRSSIYVHIDYKIGHYVKILMDEVFGRNHFINDITRIKCNPKNFERKAFGNIKDMVLFYSKTDDYIWNEEKIPFSEDDVKLLFKKIDKDGRRYTTIPLHAPGETQNGVTGGLWRGIKPPKGRHWRTDPKTLDELDKAGLIEWSKNGVPRKKIFADEMKGKKIQDVIEFKDPPNPSYPTEKNIDLLLLLIKISSERDSIVLDSFCGSGTFLKAAQLLDRKFIGIDNSDEAIKVSLKRLGSSLLNNFCFYEYYDEPEYSRFFVDSNR